MNTQDATAPALHGVMAEFPSAEELLDAARRARDAGYRQMDAYSPFPIHGMDEALALPKTQYPSSDAHRRIDRSGSGDRTAILGVGH